jgi:hypothetical protein
MRHKDVMDTAIMLLLLPIALAAGLWWLESANDKRAAEQDAVVRRTYTKDIASSPWIQRKSGDLADEAPHAEDDEDAAVLEHSASGEFRVQNKAKGSRWMPH